MMNINFLLELISEYPIEMDGVEITPIHSGLINHTYKVKTKAASFILQRVNDTVFKNPEAIENNIRLVGDYLHQTQPNYLFPTPLNTKSGKEMIKREEGYFRLFPFIENTHSKNVLENADHAYEAAFQFGQLTHFTAGLEAHKLAITLPDFHNLSLRFQQFLAACKNAHPERLQESKKPIEQILANEALVNQYEKIKSSTNYYQRVTHHDTKISNVLFNEKDQAVCVIDLDTLMPGYFFSDVGDMMRTYLSPANEEEKDIRLLTVRNPFYEAIVSGYNEKMNHHLTAAEQELFFYAGSFMLYMQGIRFLADYLNNDIYYQTSYEGQNLVRAINQLSLLSILQKKEKELRKIK